MMYETEFEIGRNLSACEAKTSGICGPLIHTSEVPQETNSSSLYTPILISRTNSEHWDGGLEQKSHICNNTSRSKEAIT